MSNNTDKTIKKLDNTNYYDLEIQDIVDKFDSNLEFGLSDDQVRNNRFIYGSNVIAKKKEKTILMMLWDQIKNPLILILILVIIIKSINFIFESSHLNYFNLQGAIEIFLVLLVVIISSVIGVKQELNAISSLEKLKSQVKFFSKVLRNGDILTIESTEIVVGDIVFLEIGDKVPADSRIVESWQSQLNESILTGESQEIEKDSQIIKIHKLSINKQKNMVFAGTSVINGKLKAIVCKIGEYTEFGKISQKIQELDNQTSKFQKQTENLLKNLVITSVFAFLILEFFYIFIFRLNILTSIETGLALIISFIPEALSAVTIIVLSISAKNLIKKGIIVKNLLSAEGLGSIDTFLTDKTGTITEGKMTVEKFWFWKKEITKSNFDNEQEIAKKVLDVLTFCNNNKGSTELALSNFIEKYDLKSTHLNRIYEYSYNSTTKRMSVIVEKRDKLIVYTKGAGEVVLNLCKFYYNNNAQELLLLTEEYKKNILEKIEKYATNGFRVLLLADKVIDNIHSLKNKEKLANKREYIENDLNFIGLVCILDPLREEVFHTVKKFKQAGVDLVMITGDHPNIAKYLAIKSQISKEEDIAISGDELEKYADLKIENIDKKTTTKILNTKVFARTTPKHKEFLVDFYKFHNKVVAMAGDGVNDAVAIKKANLGVAVKNAVDWVREIADIVITGKFDSLIKAVFEGRKIIYRARLFSHYLLSGNISQVGVFVLIAFSYQVAPLTSLQLLVINLLTDTFPALAMAYEKVPKSILKEKPEAHNSELISRPIWVSIFIQGIITSIFLYFVFGFYYENNNLIYAQTMVFLAYLSQKLYRAFTARSFVDSIFKLGLFSNKTTLYSVLASSFVALTMVFGLADYVGMEKVNLQDFLLVAIIALFVPLVEEIYKFIRNIYQKNLV